MGSSEVKVDDKGRFVIPVKWRSSFEDGAVVTRSSESCLHLWPQKTFEAQVETMRATNDGSLRLLLAFAHEEKPDAAGRVALPKELRGFAGLARDGRLVGNYERLEVWDETAWVDWSTSASERLVPAQEKPELVPS